jgi:hypothetical protein
LPFDIPAEWQKDNFYYTPPSGNAPLLKKKNDLSLSFNYGGGHKYAQSELKAAFMPSAHLGVTTNLSLSSRVGKLKFSKPEFAIGYIKPLSPALHFETYGGIEGTNIGNEHKTGKSHVRNTQLFIQPAISLHNIKNTAELGFVSRFSHVNFKVMDTSFNSARETYSAKQLQILRTNPDHIFWEPGLTFRFGWRQVLFNFNYATSLDLSKQKFAKANDNVSLGVSFRFNTTPGNFKTKD